MLPIIRCLVQACEDSEVPYRFLDENRNFVRVELGRPYYFINFASPLGRHDVVRICRDKAFTYRLIKDLIRTPRTRAYLDPLCRKEYRKYADWPSHAAIVGDMADRFGFPVIVKRNQGTRGRNVFLCQEASDIETAVTTIFDSQSKTYDYVAIAQEYVSVADEYRVILLGGDIELVYRKETGEARFAGNLSPLHWENARAVPEDDPAFLEEIRDFLSPLGRVLDLQFAGLDILKDGTGRLWLLEINSQPDFALFIRDNGDGRIIALYRKLLARLRDDST